MSAIKKQKVGPDVQRRSFPGYILDTEKLNCPVCHQLPTGEVYICLKGHSCCKTCTSKHKICSSCRSKNERSRDSYAEQILDAVNFLCPWKNYGCETVNLSRAQIFHHLSQCPKNPEAIKCSMYLPGTCEFQICPLKKHQGEQIDVIQEHLQSSTHGLQAEGSFITESCHANFDIHFDPTNLHDGILQPCLHWVDVCLVDPDNFSELLLYALVVVTGEDNHKTVSKLIVRLSPKASEKYEIVIKMRINQVNCLESTGSALSAEGVPDLSWTMNPMSISDFKKYLLMSPKEKLNAIYGHSIANLKNYYCNANGMVTFEHKFMLKSTVT